MVGASRSELSIGGATTIVTAGTQTPTSVRRGPSSTRDHQRLDSSVPTHTGMMGLGSSHHRTGFTQARLSEPTGGSGIEIETPVLTDDFTAALRRNPPTAQGGIYSRPFKTALKLRKCIFVIRILPLLTCSSVLCIPSCITDKDIIG